MVTTSAQHVDPALMHAPGPRRFVVSWDHRRAKRGGESRYIRHQAEGVIFSNGRVALDFGPAYEYLGELEDALRQWGMYDIRFLD